MPRAIAAWAGGAVVLASLGILVGAQPPVQHPLRPAPGAVEAVSPRLAERLRGDAFTYFRFINRVWTARACAAFADLRDPPIVRLHGDAHVEQFAVTQDAWGLDDFDDSTRGPIFIDIVRFLGSLDLASRQRGWAREREALWDRFFDGYRRGLVDPGYRAPEPDIVRHLRTQAPAPRDYLAWADTQMAPLDDAWVKAVETGMAGLDRLIRNTRPDLAPGYFTVVRAGWLHIGVGSASDSKILIRVQGPTAGPDDDQLIEAKEVANLEGIGCLEPSTTMQGIRVVEGTRQLGRLRHEFLAVGRTVLNPPIAERPEHWRDWWVSSWEPSYRELHISDLRSVADLADIAFDSGLQLGGGEPAAERREALSSLTTLDTRLRKETSLIVEELLAGWRELQAR